MIHPNWDYDLSYFSVLVDEFGDQQHYEDGLLGLFSKIFSNSSYFSSEISKFK